MTMEPKNSNLTDPWKDMKIINQNNTFHQKILIKTDQMDDHQIKQNDAFEKIIRKNGIILDCFDVKNQWIDQPIDYSHQKRSTIQK